MILFVVLSVISIVCVSAILVLTLYFLRDYLRRQDAKDAASIERERAAAEAMESLAAPLRKLPGVLESHQTLIEASARRQIMEIRALRTETRDGFRFVVREVVIEMRKILGLG